MSKLKTVSACRKYLGLPDTSPVIKNIPKHYQDALANEYDTWITIEAVNQEANGGKHWEPNWNNTDEWKYAVWVEIRADAKTPSGFAFSDAHAHLWGRGTIVGSRLLFFNTATAQYWIKQFKKVALGHYIIQKHK